MLILCLKKITKRFALNFSSSGLKNIILFFLPVQFFSVEVVTEDGVRLSDEIIYSQLKRVVQAAASSEVDETRRCAGRGGHIVPASGGGSRRCVRCASGGADPEFVGITRSTARRA